MRIIEMEGLVILAIMNGESVAFGVSFPFSWSRNPRIGLLSLCFSFREVVLTNLQDADPTCLNRSPSIMFMEKVEEVFDLEYFDGYLGRRFEVSSFLTYHSKRLRFELKEIWLIMRYPIESEIWLWNFVGIKSWFLHTASVQEPELSVQTHDAMVQATSV